MISGFLFLMYVGQCNPRFSLILPALEYKGLVHHSNQNQTSGHSEYPGKPCQRRNKFKCGQQCVVINDAESKKSSLLFLSHSGRSATIRESNHDSGVYKEHYA